jgi:hypothetical protein
MARGSKRKRARTRRKSKQGAEKDDKDDELGLHKLEVLTHTIEYIQELQDKIRSLEDHQSEPCAPRATAPMGTSRQHALSTERQSSSLDVNMAHLYYRPASSMIELSEEETSPSVLAAKSPLSNFSISSANTLNYKTSPMMSLSAESPLLHYDNQELSKSPPLHVDHSKDSRRCPGFEGGVTDAGNVQQSAQKSQPTCGPKEVQGESWQMLPEPFLSLNERISDAVPQDRLRDASYEAARSQIRADARLLLSLKRTSIAERPMSALRQTSNLEWTSRRRSASVVKATDLSPADAAKKGWGSTDRMATISSQSAPGGAYPTTHLLSPPLFALDGKPCNEKKDAGKGDSASAQ